MLEYAHGAASDDNLTITYSSLEIDLPWTDRHNST
jgi:hypothetical protein